MPKLSSNQLQEYNDNGYVAPIEVLDQEDMKIRKKANEDLQGIFYPTAEILKAKPTKIKTILNIFCKQISLQKRLLVLQYLAHLNS